MLVGIIVTKYLSLFIKAFIGLLAPCSLTNFPALGRALVARCLRVQSKGSRLIIIPRTSVGVDLPAPYMVLRVSFLVLSSAYLAVVSVVFPSRLPPRR